MAAKQEVFNSYSKALPLKSSISPMLTSMNQMDLSERPDRGVGNLPRKTPYDRPGDRNHSIPPKLDAATDTVALSGTANTKTSQETSQTISLADPAIRDAVERFKNRIMGAVLDDILNSCQDQESSSKSRDTSSQSSSSSSSSQSKQRQARNQSSGKRQRNSSVKPKGDGSGN
ncbi:hypothetical protein EJ04DRAFT_526389 [Polyplosphaeria fusca]|uniref:Uncharacterized protein n=1 Tax=Polyplosphaeria fusca TaxID=682080 RepID=A0A9P4V0C9_9PLEO|nr:hypothetical protein EJ04DRAFT_526389 [Polyplosphaeria fusca]